MDSKLVIHGEQKWPTTARAGGPCDGRARSSPLLIKIQARGGRNRQIGQVQVTQGDRWHGTAGTRRGTCDKGMPREGRAPLANTGSSRSLEAPGRCPEGPVE